MAAPVKPKLSLSMVKNAVIIDSDNSMLSLVGNYLTKASVGGLQKFNSGEEAFKYIEQNPVDLVILDWKMKNPTGLALYEKIRAMENAIQLPIVLISGVVTPNDVQIAQVDKFAKFIVKPFAEEVFLSSISKFVGKPSTTQKQNSQTNSGSESGKTASGAQNQTMTNSQGKPSDMQIVRNGTNGKDDQGGLVIVAGGKANGLGLQVDKGQRISGNGTEIFDQDGLGPEMNARQSGPGQGDEFSAVQKRDGGSDMEIRQSRAGNGTEINAKQEGHSGQGFSMNQEGSGPGSSMNGSFAKDGIGGSGFDVSVEGPKTGNNFDGKFEAQKPGAANDGEFEKLKAGVSANTSMSPNQSGKGFNVNAQNEGLPTGQDFLDPKNNSGSGGDATQSNGSGNGFNINQNGVGSVGDISGTQQTSPANGQDYQSSGTESANNASDGMNQDADRVIPKPSGFALDDGDVGVPERVKKTLCKAVVMGSQVEVFVPLDVLVVDHDEAQQKLIAQHLTEIGAEKVQCLSESPTAWDRIQAEPFDLIIIDWKLKGLSGLALYSRIRERAETASTPVIVMSGFVHKEDFRLLGESHYTKFLEKPIKKNDFESVLKDTLTEAATHDKITSMIGNLIDKMKGDSKKIVQLIEGLLKNIANPFIFVLCAGEHLLNKGDLDNAEKVLRIAQRIDGNNVTVITELSKIYHRTGRSDLAIVMLSKANTMSPDSIERLCLMGEIGLTVQDPERARKYFEATLKIDKENVKANAGMVLANNLKDSGLPPVNGKSVSNTLASSLNAVAVTYVKNAQIAKAISQYQAAMCFVYDPGTIARLQFNMGMAYLRDKKLSEASKWLKVSAQNATPDFTKSASVLDKLQNFLQKYEKDASGGSDKLAEQFMAENKEMVADASAAIVKIGESGQILEGANSKVAS